VALDPESSMSKLSCWSLLLSVVAACGGGDDAPPLPTDGPLYVGATRVFTADSSVGYLFAVPSLAAGTEVDLGQAVEMNDAWVFGDGNPYFYAATLFEPTIVRWELSAEGRFVQGPTVSFANQGVGGTYQAAFTPVFSATRSYFVDDASGQVVIWNPTDMTFVGTIPLDAPPRDGMEVSFGLSVGDGRLLVSAFWASGTSGWTQFGDSTRLFVIDTATDTVVSTTDDTRCETASPAGITSDGTAYFTPWDYHTVVRHVFGEGFGAGSCGLRVVPSGTGFDEGYQIDLGSLVGGRPAGNVRIVGDDQALIHVWHDEQVTATPETWADKRFEPGYRWYRWTIGEAAATELAGQSPSGEGGDWAVIDGKGYLYSPNSEFSATTLIELDDTGALVPGITVPGWTVSVIRAR
jgi:hypothetical protein